MNDDDPVTVQTRTNPEQGYVIPTAPSTFYHDGDEYMSSRGYLYRWSDGWQRLTPEQAEEVLQCT